MAMRSLARFLREWLDENETTQRQLAGDLEGVTETRVSRWVTGHDVPGPKYRDALAERVGITRHQLDRFCLHDNRARALDEITTMERALQRLRSMVDNT